MPLSPYYQNLRKKFGTDLLLLPGVCTLVFNDQNQILLGRRSDTGRWSVLGGMLDPHENPADAAVREVFEETGIRVTPERITGIYIIPPITYPDGNQVQYLITAFRCRHLSGTPHVHDDESLEIRYFSADALPELPPDQLERIEHARLPGPTFFASPTENPASFPSAPPPNRA